MLELEETDGNHQHLEKWYGLGLSNEEMMSVGGLMMSYLEDVQILL